MRLLLLLSVILLAAWMGAAVGESTRSLMAEPAKTGTQQKPATTPVKKPESGKKPDAAKKPEAGAGRTAAGGSKPQAGGKPEQGQGARPGIGRFDTLSPDKPQAQWLGSGKRLLAEPAKTTQQKPAATPAKDAKKPESGKKPEAAKKPEAGAGSKPQAGGKPEQGQGARPGIGRFTSLSPDKPQAEWSGSGKRLLAEPAKTTQQKPATTPAKDAKKPESGKKPDAAKKPEAGAGRTAAGGSKPQAGGKPEQGQGARPGIGRFDTLSPDKPQAQWLGSGKRLLAEPAKTTQQKPAATPAKDAKKPESGKKPEAAKKPEAGAGSKPQAGGKPEQGQGARPGIGRFTSLSPDKPQAEWSGSGKR